MKFLNKNLLKLIVLFTFSALSQNAHAIQINELCDEYVYTLVDFGKDIQLNKSALEKATNKPLQEHLEKQIKDKEETVDTYITIIKKTCFSEKAREPIEDK